MEDNGEEKQPFISDSSCDSSDYGEYLNQYDDNISIEEHKFGIEYVNTGTEDNVGIEYTTGTADEEPYISNSDIKVETTDTANDNVYIAENDIKGETTETANDAYFSDSDIKDNYEANNYKFRHGISLYNRFETLKKNVIILGSKPNEKINSFFDTKSLKYSTDSDTDDDEDVSIAALSKKKENYIVEDVRPQKEITQIVNKQEYETNEDKETDIQLGQGNINDRNTKENKTCQHCKEIFEDKDQLIDHLTQVAKEKSFIEIKQKLLNDLRKDFGVLPDYTKSSNDKTEETNINVDTQAHSTVSFVNKINERSNNIKQLTKPKKSAKSRTVEAISDKNIRGTNKEKKTRTKNTLHSRVKSKTPSKKSNTRERKKTDKHIKMKIKLKNKFTKEYAVEHTIIFNKLDVAEHLQRNVSSETYITHEPKAPVLNKEFDFPSNIERDQDMPLLSEIKPIYFDKQDHLKLNKINPFPVNLQSLSTKDITPNNAAQAQDIQKINPNNMHFDNLKSPYANKYKKDDTKPATEINNFKVKQSICCKCNTPFYKPLFKNEQNLRKHSRNCNYLFGKNCLDSQNFLQNKLHDLSNTMANPKCNMNADEMPKVQTFRRNYQKLIDQTLDQTRQYEAEYANFMTNHHFYMNQFNVISKWHHTHFNSDKKM